MVGARNHPTTTSFGDADLSSDNLVVGSMSKKLVTVVVSRKESVARKQRDGTNRALTDDLIAAPLSEESH